MYNYIQSYSIMCVMHNYRDMFHLVTENASLNSLTTKIGFGE